MHVVKTHQVSSDSFSGATFTGNDESLVLLFVDHGVVGLVGHREHVSRLVVLGRVPVSGHDPEQNNESVVKN